MGIYFATDIDRINNEYMPRLNLEIGRYINYSKLESMLSTQTLFFCNASRFDDEYEGEIPLEFFDGWAQQSEENYRRLNELKSHVCIFGRHLLLRVKPYIHRRRNISEFLIKLLIRQSNGLNSIQRKSNFRRRTLAYYFQD